MSFCICCHSSLLRYVRHSDVYWFCPSCWQEMPNIEQPSTSSPIQEEPPELAHRHLQTDHL